jgi:superfamily II DNA or RNA helicase
MKKEMDRGLADIIEMMPFEPYDYQLKCARDNLLHNRQISLACTSAGKSAIALLIMYFLYKKGKKGYLIVPNIGLLTQLYDDFGGYFKDEYSTERDEFLGCIDKQGGGHQSEFDSFLTISTWQSLANRKGVLDKADFILCDELHRYAADVSSEIVKASTKAKMRFGLTGTLPEDPAATMTLLGMFGAPKRYIRACELIERGLATPVEIISFILKYSDEDKRIFMEAIMNPPEPNEKLKQVIKRFKTFKVKEI